MQVAPYIYSFTGKTINHDIKMVAMWTAILAIPHYRTDFVTKLGEIFI
jgi:hypothetical protein